MVEELLVKPDKHRKAWKQTSHFLPGCTGVTAMTKNVFYLFSLLAVLFSFGCGGGGGGGGDVASSSAKATISFSLISSATLPFRISGVQINATLPPGFMAGSSGPITSGLEPGSSASTGVTTDFPLSGSYVAPNLITLIIADATNGQSGFGPGEIVRLTCPLAEGVNSESELQAALEKALLDKAITFKVSGWNPTATSNPSLYAVGLLTPKITVTLVK
jgi:hypothetical protein